MSYPLMPLPFDAITSAVLPIPTADRPAGDILYHVRAMDSYREQITSRDGSYQSIRTFVPWDTADEFADFTIGHTNWVRTDPTRFHRAIPMKSPFVGTSPDARPLYAESCEMSQYGTYGKSLAADGAANNWPLADWCEYDITLRSHLYETLTDAEIDSADYPWAAYECKELGRYVQRIARSVAEELRIGQYVLQVEKTPGDWVDIPANGFIPHTYTEWSYHWFQCPEDAVPHDAIAACSLKVHGFGSPLAVQPFDKKRNVAGTAWVDRFAPETLLFKGLGSELTPYPGPRGEPLVDVIYLFKYQAQGHNHFGRGDPNAAWKPLRRKVNELPLYGIADFRTLFKPRTS